MMLAGTLFAAAFQAPQPLRSARRTAATMQLGPGAIEAGRRAAVNVLIAAAITNTLPGLANTRRVFTAANAVESPPKFQRLQRIQFIAALGDPEATSGKGAETWGLWREDPGPQGVRLSGYQSKLAATGGKAPAGWQFDNNAWWLEEHGLIMPGTDPLPLTKVMREGDKLTTTQDFKRYVVTGDREVTSILTGAPPIVGIDPPFACARAADSADDGHRTPHNAHRTPHLATAPRPAARARAWQSTATASGSCPRASCTTSRTCRAAPRCTRRRRPARRARPRRRGRRTSPSSRARRCPR
eukprot:Transcript_25118.p1 GENE.Transcript_25118~~Transcript_25118.p1  ORF type:complete len:299 (-),score=29.07 Transcript_25118:237-1133(-)